MANKYQDKQGGFAAQLQAFRDQTLQASEDAFQGIMLGLASKIIEKSPVGDPDRWDANVKHRAANKAEADAYDANVDVRNVVISLTPSNYTKSGRLKKSVKYAKPLTKTERVQNFNVNGLVAGKGYIGGRFRANWQFQAGSPASGEVDAVDPSGNKTLSVIRAGIQSLKIGETAYLVNNLPYAIPLEYGHSSIAPSGMVGTTVSEFQQIVLEAVEANKI
jgi:hypothetical protein